MSRRAASSVRGTATSRVRTAAATPPRLPWVWLVPALAAIALYARTVRFGFVWDDLDLIVRNAALQGPQWPRLLFQDFWHSTGGGTGMWRPLVTLSNRVDGSWTGWQAWGFHLVNVLAFAAASALVAWLLAPRVRHASSAMVAGLVYATAPALSESTAWIAGRTDLFAALFTLAALWLARGAREHHSRSRFYGSLACLALALLSKESALVLPLLLLANAADDAKPGEPVAWRTVLPSLALVALWAIAHRLVVPGSSHPPTPGAARGMAALVWATLGWLAPWAPHSPLLDLWQPPSFGIAAMAWIALAAASWLAVSCARRRVPVTLALALLFAPLLPVAAAALLEQGVRFAERSLALPCAGLALLIGWAIDRVPVRMRTVAIGAATVWIAWQLAVAWPAISAWRNEETRIRRVADLRPNDTDALLGMADLLSVEGREVEALQWVGRAEAVAPNDAGPLVARASIAYRTGRLDEALAAADRALKLAPDDLAAGMLQVRALAKLGRGAEAVAAGEKLVAAHPNDAPAEGALGSARLAAGDVARAVPALEHASAQLLDDAGLAWDLGRAAVAAGNVALAATAFERAVTASPAFYDAWLGLADTRSRLGDRDGAEQALVRAEALPEASDGRAKILADSMRSR